jgi:hypothetical protein
MEIDGKNASFVTGLLVRPIAPAHTAQSGICVRRTKPAVILSFAIFSSASLRG